MAGHPDSGGFGLTGAVRGSAHLAILGNISLLLAADEATGLWAAAARAGRALAVGDAPRGGAVVQEIVP
jgi:hypothetical protein